MRSGLEALRLMLHATFAWCAGAVFAVVWLWLFFGIQLDRRQAQAVIVVFGVLGLCFGAVQAWRQHRRSVVPPAVDPASPPGAR